MIDPSKLIARIMTFALAAALAVFVTLAAAVTRLFPLSRTEVFFLRARPAADLAVRIEGFDSASADLREFREGFIKEYILARNQIIPSNQVMRRKWRADSDGLVYAYSSGPVYAAFMKTDMWQAVMEGKYQPLTFSCDVSFGRFYPRANAGGVETVAVSFRYACANESSGQGAGKDFTISVSTAFQDSVKWGERLDNPLGLKVVGYEVESGGADPLNVL